MGVIFTNRLITDDVKTRIKELFRIEVWPLERVAQHNSMSKLLGHLDKFKYEPHSLTCTTHKRLD